MRKTELKQFTLQKVKLKEQGLEVKFEVEETSGVEVYHDEKNVKSDKTPHPDLKGVLTVLGGYMAEIFFFSTLNELRDSNVFEATAAQAKILNEKYNTLKNAISITGVALSGKEENRGIIITSTLKVETGQKVALNSPRIKYSGTTYGFEEDLEELMDGLENEVYEYIVNGKQAQLEMAFDSADDSKMAAAGEHTQEQLLDHAEKALEETE